MKNQAKSRRAFVGSVALGGAAALVGCGRSAQSSARADAPEHREPSREAAHGGAEITPGEDLMREHGVLQRVLVVWSEIDGRLRRGDDLDVAALRSSVELVQRFIERYHERMEEELVFPRLERAGREVALVRTLREQHEVGRTLTTEVLRLVGADMGRESRGRIADRLGDYRRMYLAHASREDTVVFPALREIVGSGYPELGEQMEEAEHTIVGEGGFDAAVTEAERIERAFGLDALSRFTPTPSPA